MLATDSACSDAYGDIVRLARRFVRTEEDARDLAQHALMVALDRGFADWASPARRAWLGGVLRRHAAFVARTEARRARRERLGVSKCGGESVAWTWRASFLAALPPSLRTVATLAAADMCAEEVRWLLRLTPEALRTRLSALRRAIRAESESPTVRRSEPPHTLGPRRAVLLAGLKNTNLPMVATHDPDGHAIFFRIVAHSEGGSGNTRVKGSSHA